MDWSIQEIARLSGTTSRTLRHYGDIGLLAPTRVGANGYRYYDERALVRLQRILILRDLGLGLVEIGRVIDGGTDDADALTGHLHALQQEQNRLARQIGAVERTIEKLSRGEQLMAEEALDGFDHTVYQDEVERRWGEDAFAPGDAWWRAKSAAAKTEWTTLQNALAADWVAAAASGSAVDSAAARALAQRQFDWLGGIPGLPALTREYFVGLGEMYLADERFATNYGGQQGAAFVRDAMAAWAARML
jgi:DNA-binding transcriptional MerR regulator